MITQPSPTDPVAIDQAWRALQVADGAQLLASRAAERLGVSEAALIASRCGQGATRLRCGVEALLTAAGSLGTVKAVTRNRSVVHEHHGAYSRVTVQPPVHGMVLDPGIDLRIVLPRWVHAFALEAEHGGRVSRSLQFFDATGTAVHKIFCRDDDQADAFHALCAAHADADQDPAFAAAPEEAAPAANDARRVDAAALEAAWRAMRDPHEFMGLLRRFGLDKPQANRLVGDDLARRCAPGSLRRVLTRAADEAVPVMVFVGNPGCIQIHTGPIARIVDARGWLNVLDPDFHLHVDEAAIAETWAVCKPAEHGRTVHSVECFAADGTTLISLYGERKPGRDERSEWRAIHAGLPDAEDA